jgi:hypothetical protein
MPFTITPAARKGIIPLIFIWGGTGGGKSLSALLMARGMAGPKGRVVCGDTENGRALLCADQVDGGFSHIDFQPPFTPERYCELIETMENNADVGVIDSLSHLWSGPDGVLEMHEEILDRMVGNDWAKREAASWRAWKEPKARLQVFKDKLMRAKIPIIGCFRGEEKSQLIKDDKGKSQIVTSKTTLPIFDKKLIFEALIAFETYQEEGRGGLIRMPYPHAKISHPSLGAILPKPETERMSQAHGAAIAAWCNNAGKPPTSAPTAQPAASTPAPPKEATEATRTWFIAQLQPFKDRAFQYAIDKGFIMPDQPLEAWALSKVPTSRPALLELISQIEKHT